jgi:hypothetical protein
VRLLLPGKTTHQDSKAEILKPQPHRRQIRLVNKERHQLMKPAPAIKSRQEHQLRLEVIRAAFAFLIIGFLEEFWRLVGHHIFEIVRLHLRF